MRTHTDYGKIIHDQPSHKSFRDNLELFQYKTAPTITGGMQGLSWVKPFMELGLNYQNPEDD